MIKHKNKHESSRKKGWAVRREGSEKVSKLFISQSEAMDYAGRIAKKDDVTMVVHKHNGEFKNFTHGYEIHIKVHKISPIIGPIEEVRVITYPIVNNTEPIIETVNLV